jgi:hypothetical protein
MRLKTTIQEAVREAISAELHPARNLELLTVEDLARIFRVSRASAYASLGKRIPSVRLGRLVRFRVDDVRAFIDANTHGGPSVSPRSRSSVRVTSAAPPPARELSPRFREIRESLRRGSRPRP